MTARLLEYRGRLLGEYKPTEHPGDRFGVLSVVINLRGKGNSSRQMQLKASRPGLFTSLGVGEWNLRDEDAVATVEAVARGEVPRVALLWVPLMRGGQDGTIIKRWREVADQEASPNIRETYEGVLVFAEAAGCEDVWKNGLKGFNMVRSKVADEWRAEARQEGIEKGKEEERREKLRRVLLGRFKAIPSDIEQRVAGADLATLDRVFDTATIGTLDEVRAQL